MRSLVAAALLVTALGGQAYGQTPYLVQDLNPAVDPIGGVAPTSMAPSGPTLYFAGSDQASGDELFRTDGTAGGTRLVVDLDPWSEFLAPMGLTGVDGAVFFVRRPFVGPLELWRSDGTPAGTTFVMVFEPVTGSSSFGIVGLGPIVLFPAMNGGFPALWRSDGTPGGTFMLRLGEVTELTVAGTTAYFSASDPGTGVELWKTDGTDVGTVLVRDICPGTCSGGPPHLAAVGNEVFFAANEPNTGTELWKSDGTPAGTTLVKDIVPGDQSSAPSMLTGAGNRLFFDILTPGGSELWKSDGTAVGTVLVKQVSFAMLTPSGSNVFFIGFESATGSEPWFSDGTTAGTHIAADICSGPCDGFPPTSQPELAAAGSLLYFSRRRSPDLTELWRSDGTTAGTFQVRTWKEVAHLSAFAGEMFFAGNDGTNGLELWRTNGTDAGTVRLTDQVQNSSFPQFPIRVGEKIFFTAEEPSVGPELWSTGGTPASTAVLDLFPGPTTSAPHIGTAVGDRLLFAARLDPSFWSILSTDGTMAGTQHLLEASAALLQPGSTVEGLAVLGAGPAADFSGREPWRSDGTPAGTALIEDLAPGSSGSEPEFLATRGDTLFFRAATPCAICLGLWRTDGTAEGTSLVATGTVITGAITGSSMLRETLFVARDDGASGMELWASDGTPSGTRLVKDIVPGSVGAYPLRHTTVGDLVFFVTGSPTAGGNLWRSDGTDVGTYQIKDFSPGPTNGKNPVGLTALNSLLYFIADDGVHGRELWRSDGTAAGTVMVKDIWPGPGSALSNDEFTPLMIAAGGRLFFDAYTPDTGIEPWESDGTAAGTVALTEVAPGPRSSAPALLTWAGSRMYFRAHDGVHGWEPWAVDLPTAVSVDDVSVTEGDSGTLDAVFALRLSRPSTQAVTVAYATSDRSAGAPADYAPRAGTVTFAAGSVGPELVPVPVVGDLRDEPDESFVLDLSSPAGAVLADAQATAIVLDDDAPTVQVANVTVTEGNIGVVNADFVVTLITADGNATAVARTFAFATEPLTASAPEDFNTAVGSITFAAGTPSGGTAIARVTVNGDTADEPDETFQLRLTPTSDVTAPIAPAIGTILDDDGPASSRPLELTHGMTLRADLASVTGADRDWYLIRQQPYSSYEIVVDEASGDVGPLQLRRWATDGSTVLQSGVPTGSGPSVSIRWQNAASTSIEGEHVSVESGGCGTDCGADDTYRVRAYETTLAIPRFNNANGLVTFLMLQNPTDHAISGHVWPWSPGGYLWTDQVTFTVPPRGILVEQVTGGFSSATGSLTITHDGGYGELAAKAVALEPATGFSFDTPARPRER